MWRILFSFTSSLPWTMRCNFRKKTLPSSMINHYFNILAKQRKAFWFSEITSGLPIALNCWGLQMEILFYYIIPYGKVIGYFFFKSLFIPGDSIWAKRHLKISWQSFKSGINSGLNVLFNAGKSYSRRGICAVLNTYNLIKFNLYLNGFRLFKETFHFKHSNS